MSNDNIPKTYQNQLINSIKTLSVPLTLTSIALSANAADEVVKKTKKPKVKGSNCYYHHYSHYYHSYNFIRN